MFTSTTFYSIGQRVRAMRVLLIAALAVGMAGEVLAQSAAGPFARFNSWWRNPANGTLGFTTGAQLCIDLDGNGNAESCYANPSVPAGAATNVRLSPTRRVLMMFGNTSVCNGSSMVHFFDVPDPPGSLTLIDSACIPRNVNSGHVGFYDTGLCCDGLTDLACAGAMGLVCTDGGGGSLLGVSPQRIAYVADQGDPFTQRVQIYWFDLNGGTHAQTFPGFDSALQLTRVPVSPYGDAAFVQHDTGGTDSNYTVVDLCGGTRLGRSLSSNVGGALFGLPNPTATSEMLDNGGGNYEIRVTHPSLTTGMLDLPFTPCSGTPPPVNGACCRLDVCSVETAEDCELIPGDWLGPMTTCAECPMATLSVNISGPGSVSSNPAGISCPAVCSGDYPENTMVTLTAMANAGAQFLSWGGQCSGVSPVTQVTLNGDKKCTANFAVVADLAIVKQDDADPVIAGTAFTYTITVTNNGPSTATGVMVGDNLSSVLSFDPATSDPGCDAVGNSVSCALGDMPNGAVAVRTIGVTVDPMARGQVANTASVSAMTLDTVSNNNSSTAITQVNAEADLSVIKSAHPDPVTAGGRLTYEIEIFNAGPSSATGVVIMDTLPPGVTTLGNPSNPMQVGCNAGNGSVGLLESVVVSFAVVVDPGTVSGTMLTNVVEVMGNETDPNLTNNVDSFDSLVSGASPAPAEHGFVMVADTSTPIPAGSGNFTNVFGPDLAVLSDGNVAFRGRGMNQQDGIYAQINGVLEVIADTSTPIPGGTGTFSTGLSFGFSVPSIDGEDVAFGGDDSTVSQRGVYARIGGVLQVIADKTSRPPGAAFPFSTLGGASLDNGMLSFWAFVPAAPILEGIYLGGPTGFSKIVDENTFIPGGGGRFVGFVSLAQHGRGNVAFFGYDSTFASGLYVSNGGALQVIANKNTPIPGGGGLINLFPETMAFDGSNIAFLGNNAALTEPRIYSRDCVGLSPAVDNQTAVPCGMGTFTGFSNLSIDGGNLAFIGLSAEGSGLYADFGGQLIKIVRLLDTIDGKKVSGLRMGWEALDGDQLAFQARFTDGSEGIYRADISRSGVCHPYDDDADGDHDLRDHAAFEACFSGAGNNHAAGCQLFDADGDGDIDGDDYAVFESRLTGPLPPPPVEACCLANGTVCMMLEPDACQFLQNGTVMAGVDCASNPCTPTMGACCSIEGCFVTTQQICNGLEGQYFPGEDCQSAPCKP